MGILSVVVAVVGCSSTGEPPPDAPANAETLPPAPVSECTPATCAGAGATCGSITDGCGGTVSCGTCDEGQTCGAGGANKCGVGVCTPTTCAAAGLACGQLMDGCGGVLECGACAPGSNCQNGVCACVPKTCGAMGANCGSVEDGCGGTLNCGTCANGQNCGGGGANVCGAPACTPNTACTGRCGTVTDGCGGTVSCPPCADTTSCATQSLGLTGKFEVKPHLLAGAAPGDTAEEDSEYAVISWTPPQSGTYVFDQNTSVGVTSRVTFHESCTGPKIAEWLVHRPRGHGWRQRL